MGLFGLTPSKPKVQPTQNQSGFVFDVTTQDFQERVVTASMQIPVIVDFWAPWCGPCKQLMPILEAEAEAAKGEVLLAKVNIDENPELAQALRVQSVPTVMAFFQGQPVTAFTGARPASDIKNLMAQLIKIARSAQPDALDIPTVLKEAAAHLAAQDYGMAQQLYIRVLQQDENNVDAYTGMVRTLIAAGAVDEAETLVIKAPEATVKHPNFAAAKIALDLALSAKEQAGALPALIKKLEKTPDDFQVRYDLAIAQFASGDRVGAIDNLLDLIRRDRMWNDEAPRKELLRYFEAMGFADPLSVDGRKKLSRLLFS